MRRQTDVDEDASALRILYLRIAESADGFRWQVRLHGTPDPIAYDARPFHSESAARAAGQGALNRACGQFEALTGFD